KEQLSVRPPRAVARSGEFLLAGGVKQRMEPRPSPSELRADTSSVDQRHTDCPVGSGDVDPTTPTGDATDRRTPSQAALRLRADTGTEHPTPAGEARDYRTPVEGPLPVWARLSRPSLQGAPGRRCWSWWSARSGARTNDLDHPEGRCTLVVGRWTAGWGRPALPGCSTTIVSSATTIVIWVSPVGARSHQCYKAVQRVGWRARPLRELTAVKTRDVGVGGPGRRRRRRSGRRHGVDDVGIDVAQDVVAAAGQFSGDGDPGELAVVP